MELEAHLHEDETLRRGNLLFRIPAQRVLLLTERPRELVLTPLEFRLLLHFAINEERVLSREHLIDTVWGSGVHVVDRTVDTHVSNLRKKIALADYEFRAVHGVGYSFQRRATTRQAA